MVNVGQKTDFHVVKIIMLDVKIVESLNKSLLVLLIVCTISER